MRRPSKDVVEEILRDVKREREILGAGTPGQVNRLNIVIPILEALKAELPQDLGGPGPTATWDELNRDTQDDLSGRLLQILHALADIADRPANPSSIMAKTHVTNGWIWFLGIYGLGLFLLLVTAVISNWELSVPVSQGEDLDAKRASLTEKTKARSEAEQTLANAKSQLAELEKQQAQLQQEGDNASADALKETADALAKAKQVLTTAQKSVSDLEAEELKPGSSESTPTSPSEKQVLIMVAFMGGLGGLLHYLSSFAVFVGNRRLFRSWVPHYLFLPFRGAGLSMVIYLLLRVGVLSPSARAAEDTSNLNHHAIYGFCVLAGMFAKPATDKLAEVFLTLFRTDKKSEADSAT